VSETAQAELRRDEWKPLPRVVVAVHLHEAGLTQPVPLDQVLQQHRALWPYSPLYPRMLNPHVLI